MLNLINTKLLFIILIIFTSLLFLIYFGTNNSYDNDKIQLIKNITDFVTSNNQDSIDELEKSLLADKNYNTIDFEGFDNENGVDHFIVPNIVHLLYFQFQEIQFYQAINLYSIFLNQNPDIIYIHCDKCDFHGKFWDQINSIDKLKAKIKINKIQFHDTIFGLKYGWVNHHRSDVWRLMVLMSYGGMFFDNDVYIVKSLDEYRKYEMTVSWDGDNEGLGVQVLIANRNARLLRAHFDMYRTNYSSGEWYYNAGYVPAKILLKNRNLAHAVKIKLGTHMLIHNLYKTNWPGWKELNSIHLLINHRSYLDKESPIKNFDEFNILNFNYTYGDMCRNIMDRIKPFLANNKF